MHKIWLAVLSNSSSSPCVLVPKVDLTHRSCADYREVNSVTKSDPFPLSRVEDCTDRVVTACYVTKLKWYWQVPLTQRASDISAFVTPDNFLQYTVTHLARVMLLPTFSKSFGLCCLVLITLTLYK